MINSEFRAVFLACLAHAVAFGERNRHWLFAQDGLDAGLGRRAGVLGVCRRGRRNDQDVGYRARQQISKAGEMAVGGNRVLALGVAERVGADIANRTDFESGAARRLHMTPAHPAKSDNRDVRTTRRRHLT
jgi:hypothetical protein